MDPPSKQPPPLSSTHDAPSFDEASPPPPLPVSASLSTETGLVSQQAIVNEQAKSDIEKGSVASSLITPSHAPPPSSPSQILVPPSPFSPSLLPHFVLDAVHEGMEKVVLRDVRGSTAEIFLHGGHVTSWKNERGEEQLFLSSKSVFKPPKAIRGGIPVCFPQFGMFGPMDQQHGYVRNRKWKIVSPVISHISNLGGGPKSESGANADVDSAGSKGLTSVERNELYGNVLLNDFGRADVSFADFVFQPSEEDLKLHPQNFELRMRVCLVPSDFSPVLSNMHLFSSSLSPSFPPKSTTASEEEEKEKSGNEEEKGREGSVVIDDVQRLESLISTPSDRKSVLSSLTCSPSPALSSLSSSALVTVLHVVNKDEKVMQFTCALHTYFAVSDISEVRIEGLEALEFFDNLSKDADSEKEKERDKDRGEEKHKLSRATDQGDAITFEGEFDRIYLSTPPLIKIVDHDRKKTILVKKEGLPDAVVWNPWEKKSRTMSDLGDEEFKRFVCVEAGAIEHSLSLAPAPLLVETESGEKRREGGEWRAMQCLSCVPSSFHSGQLDPKRVAEES